LAADYYAVLGIERGASEAEVKRAYRSLARQHHPDVAEDKIAAETKFKEINEAYEVLSDPEKRRMYDRYGSSGGNGSFSSAGDGIGDGRAASPQRRGPQRGADLRYDLQIGLAEAYRGTEREISFNHLSVCETCNGNGSRPGTFPITCDRCSGTGVMRSVRQTPLGQFVTQSSCVKCGGEGMVVPTPCEVCKGKGRVERPRVLKVSIPAGVDDGSRIRVSGSGEAGARSGPPGDLYVYVSVAPHPRFRREGLDLFIDVPITFAQAALGAQIQVDSLDGKLPLTVASGTQSGTTYRLRGRGMPSVRGSGRGDELVTVHVAVPSKLTRKERDLLEEYARVSGDHIDERSFFDRFKDAFKGD
jgi:molecular chaperone DnaJ